MIILTCNDCYSTHLKKYEGKMTDKGYDWLTCEECKKNFPLSKAGIQEEHNIF